MMNVPPIVTAGFDDLIPVIIIITVIITRIVKAAKQGKPLVPPAPGTRPRPTPRPQPQPQAGQPADELRQFLQALSGVQEPPPTPVQVRPPQPPPPPAKAKRRVVKAAAPKPPQPKKPAPFWNQPPPAPRPVIVEACELTPARQELNKHLEDATSLRGAWILREVLGPPVGLRR